VKTALVRPLPTLPPFVSSDEDGRLLTTAMLTLDETAFIAGGILKRNRERLRSKHGEWLPWLKKHFGRSETTARRYMFYYDTCMTSDPPRLLPYRDDEDEEPKPSTVEDLDQAITNVEFYTPAVFVEAARKVLGEIDLDPGSNPEANEKVVRAKKIYTKDDSGLAPHNEWHGRVFCNPPYQGLTGKFARKLLAEYEAGRTTAAIFLVTNQGTRTRWFQDLAAGHCVCLVSVPVQWWGPDAQEGAGPWGSVFIFLDDEDGAEPDDFINEFDRFGAVGLLQGSRG
jgi:hypothetical protein